jgi:hypothetical protein
MILTFLSPPHSHNSFAHSSPAMIIPLFLLSLGAALFGYLTSELFLALPLPLFTHPDNLIQVELLIFPLSLTLLPLLSLLLIITIIPIPIAYLGSQIDTKYSTSSFLSHFNTVNGWIIHNTLTFALSLSRYWDRGILELIGPTGLLNLFHYYSFKLELLSTGFLTHYALLLYLFFIPLTLITSIPYLTSELFRNIGQSNHHIPLTVLLTTLMHMKFEILYYVIGILYLIFDLEIIFLFPASALDIWLSRGDSTFNSIPIFTVGSIL